MSLLPCVDDACEHVLGKGFEAYPIKCIMADERTGESRRSLCVLCVCVSNHMCVAVLCSFLVISSCMNEITHCLAAHQRTNGPTATPSILKSTFSLPSSI